MSAPVDELTQQANMAEEGAAAEQLAPEGDTELAELIAASSVPPVPVLTTCLAGALSALAAAWLVSGLFRGFEARAIAISAVLIGTGLVYVSVRFSRPRLQYLLLPIALIMGAILVAPDARQGVASMPALVLDALRSGGILQPPIDFEPGWRLVLTAVFTMLCGGSCALGLALEKPRAAAAMPVPVALGAALLQPPGAEVISAVIAAVLVVAALAVSYGADLSRQGPLSGSFETRRLLRSGALAAGLVAAVFVLNQFGFFFPQANREHVDPPQRPRVPPPAPDVPLFAVKMDQKVPLRLGVIDVYKDGAFMLPPQDTRRLDRLNPPARLAARAKGEPPPAGAPQKTFTADITVEQATGHLLPDLAWSRSVGGREVPIVYDPRTNTLKLSGRPLYSGLHYTITAGVPPDGRALAKGGPLPAEAKQYLEAPPVPLEVKTILDKAPENPFDRLQAVRNALYLHVVAAGTGQPTDVSAQRVVQMLQGGQANPYEITAAEALLGRWAGIPSRIGYGYFGGADKGNGVNEIRPKHGSTWLEAYFTGYGWQPIIGVPPRAKASLSQSQKNQLNIVATDQFGLVVYLPVRTHTLLPLFVIVRYYLVRAIPVLLLLALMVVTYPGFVKGLRRRKRFAWARRRNARARIGVAYAEFRDRARDLAIGDPMATPLEFLDAVEPDDEHEELAWLVTRAMWGDYDADLALASQAEAMAASVTHRLRAAQATPTRALAFVSRTSLRDPYAPEIPNLWWPRVRERIAAQLSARRPRLPRLALRQVAASTALLALILGGAGCGSAVHALSSRALPTRLVPDQLSGFTFKEEPKAERVYVKGKRDADVIVDSGRVFTFRYNQIVEGAVQFAHLKAGYSGGDKQVIDAIQSTIGGFRPLDRTGVTATWVTLEPDQRIYLWFPRHSDAMVLLVIRNAMGAKTGDGLARALIAYGRGQQPPEVPAPGSAPTPVSTPAPAPSVPALPLPVPGQGGHP